MVDCRVTGRGLPWAGAFGRALSTTERACAVLPPPPPIRDALEGQGPQRWPQKRLDRRLEEVAKAVGGGYCRLQMPLSLALGVRETVAGHRLGTLEGGGGVTAPLPMHPSPSLRSGDELPEAVAGAVREGAP